MSSKKGINDFLKTFNPFPRSFHSLTLFVNKPIPFKNLAAVSKRSASITALKLSIDAD